MAVDINLSLDIRAPGMHTIKKSKCSKRTIMDTSNNKPETNAIFELIGLSADSPNIVPTEGCNDSIEEVLLIPCEPATEVYWNGFGQLVIRQRDWSDAD